MPKDWNTSSGGSVGASLNYSSTNSVETSREVEISRELSRADSISHETGSLLELLETRLAPVLRQEPEGKDANNPVPPPQTSLGKMLSDIAGSGIRNNSRIASILSRLEL